MIFMSISGSAAILYAENVLYERYLIEWKDR